MKFFALSMVAAFSLLVFACGSSEEPPGPPPLPAPTQPSPPTPDVQATVEAGVQATVVAASLQATAEAQAAPTNTPMPEPPTSTPEPEPTAVPPTNTPEPEPTPVPPTNTPEPEPTPYLRQTRLNLSLHPRHLQARPYPNLRARPRLLQRPSRHLLRRQTQLDSPGTGQSLSERITPYGTQTNSLLGSGRTEYIGQTMLGKLSTKNIILTTSHRGDSNTC